MTDQSSYIKNIIARLRHTQLFCDLKPSSLRSIALAVEPVHYDPGQVIVKEGDIGDSLFVLASGLLRVRSETDRGTQILGEIHKGGFFGEFALIESVKRTATIETVSPSYLLEISRDSLVEFFEANPSVKKHIQEVLKRRKEAGGQPVPPPKSKIKSAISEFLNNPEQLPLQLLTQEFEWIWCPKGQFLLNEGEQGEALFMVLDGHLRVTKNKKGMEAFVGLATRGQLLGEMSLISDEPNSATVQAITSSQLLKLKKDDFEKLLKNNHSLKETLVNTINQRKQQANRLIRRIEEGSNKSSLTLKMCEDVVRTKDLVSRNYKITDGYHRLALDLANILGEENVNWPAFGAHASKSAGYTIRKEEISSHAVLDVILKYGGWKLTPGKFIRFIEDVLEWISTSISDGNLRIFGEMAPVIVRFVEFMRTYEAGDREQLLEFLKTLKPGKSKDDGQYMLGQALLAWYDASHEQNAKRKSELMLLGNARMGLHEQIRIQPDLEQALGAPLKNHVGDELSRSIDKYLNPLPQFIQKRLKNVSVKTEQKLRKSLSALLRKIITKRMMRLHLPDHHIMLGDDVPVLDDSTNYPETLQEITDPNLVELFERFTRNSKTVKGSGAVDWVNLEDRMNFILHLFRSHQQNYSLYENPLKN